MPKKSRRSSNSSSRRRDDMSPLDWELSQNGHSQANSRDVESLGETSNLLVSCNGGSRSHGSPNNESPLTIVDTLRTEPLLTDDGGSGEPRLSGQDRPSLTGDDRSGRSHVSLEESSLAGQSLAYSNYSIDDQSRASTYISAASDGEDDENEKGGNPETSHTDRSSIPFAIYGESQDDDVSTIGGTYLFNDTVSLWDASTIATTPTVRQDIGPAPETETIYEEDEENQEEDEDKEESESRSRGSKVSELPSMPSARSKLVRGEQGTSMSTVGMESVQELAKNSRHSQQKSSDASAAGSRYTSMYDRQSSQTSAEDEVSIAGSIRSADFSGTGVMDDDPSRYIDDDYDEAYDDFDEDYDTYSFANQSLPDIYPEDSASLVAARSAGSVGGGGSRDGLPPRAPSSSRSVAWSHSGSEHAAMSLQGGRRVQSEVLYRGKMSGAVSLGGGSAAKSTSARTVRSDGFVLQQRRQDFRDMYQQHPPRAKLPSIPEVLKFGKDGPMMTKGLSGRAVVHVALSSATDGSIQDLEYTTPLVDADEMNDAYSVAHTDAGTTCVGSGRDLPWFEYMMQKHGWIEKCYSRRCYRMNAIILLCATLLISVIVALTTVETGNSPVQQDGRATTGLLRPPPAHKDVTLPTVFRRHVEDWFHTDGNYALHEDDVPFFWNIPLASANIIQENWGSCLGFTQASGVGRVHVSNETLRVVQIFGSSYVNVDTATPAGIEHAKKMDLMGSSLADVMFSPLVYEVLSQLYSRSSKAKLIVVLRHPVNRAIAMYRYLKKAKWDPSYDPSIASMSLEEFATSKYIDNNYVCRLLINKLSGGLNENDLNLAKEILRSKAVVGVYEEMQLTVEHIERYFGWLPASSDAAQCQRNSIETGLAKQAVPSIDPGSAAWELIKSHNRYDLALYDYVRTILAPYQQETIRRQLVGVTTPVA